MDFVDYLDEQHKSKIDDMAIEEFELDYLGDYSLIDNLKDYYVVLYTDTDCDGQTSALILTDIFDRIGIEYYLHISNRQDGYGLVNSVLYSIKEKITTVKPILLMTADLGITNKEACSYAYSIGYNKIIITDHHELQEDLIPQVDLLVNNKIRNNPLMQVCGAGLVYMMFLSYRNEKLDVLAGIATIGDMVSIEFGSINRTLVKNSLKLLNNGGLRDKCLTYFLEQIIYNYGYKQITEQDFAFGVCPMINSQSRMGKQNIVNEYFRTNNKLLVLEMKDTNSLRKDIQREQEQYIDDNIDKLNLSKDSINIIIVPRCNTNVLGLVSSYVLNKYGYDNFVVTHFDYGKFKGSGRAKQYSLINFIKSVTATTTEVQGGGHTFACGIAFSEEGLLVLNKLATEQKMISVGKKNIYNTCIKEIKNETIEKAYYQLAPFGVGNEQPLVKLSNVQISKVKKEKSMNILLVDSDPMSFENTTYQIIQFKSEETFHKKEIVDVVGSIVDNGLIANEIRRLK